MKKLPLFLLCVLSVYLVKAQYVESIIDYRPAPGQFVNTGFGKPSAAETLVGDANGLVTLGAYGGYIIVKMDKPIENDPNNPYGVDFTVLGNALPSWSEPGIVMVMQDNNSNGLADDTWYTLAGSDYYWTEAIHDYEITYQNPQQTEAAPVPWTDSNNGEGFVPINEYHTQAYYPTAEDIPQDAYSFSGERLVFQFNPKAEPYPATIPQCFGYADNTKVRPNEPLFTPNNPYTPEIEGCGGDPMDISWAVDAQGNSVHLSQIDFVKIYTAVNDADTNNMGEISTEIRGIVDVNPQPGWSGNTELVHIKYIPAQVALNSTFQLEAKHFDMGLPHSDQNISFATDNSHVLSITNGNILTAKDIGSATITASLDANPSLQAQLHITVEPSVGIEEFYNQALFSVYPNPVADILHIKTREPKQAQMRILDIKGIELWHSDVFQNNININFLPSGIYILQLQIDTHTQRLKFIKL